MRLKTKEESSLNVRRHLLRAATVMNGRGEVRKLLEKLGIKRRVSRQLLLSLCSRQERDLPLKGR